MRWFGESWGAPVNETTDHVDTPVGESCAQGCGRPIAEGDQGVLIPGVNTLTLQGRFLMRDGSTEDTFVERVQAEHAYHLDCFLRSIGMRIADETP